jgi:ribosome-associated toxin RatA of RatAB toxin-antitoxin module
MDALNSRKRDVIALILVSAFFTLRPNMAKGWDEDLLRKGEVLFVLEDRGADQIPEGRAAGLIDCPPERVWKLLNDYNNLKNTIPGVVESRIERVEGDVVYYYEQTHVPVLKDLWYRLRCVQDDRKLEKTMTLVEGSMRYLQSRWSVRPFDNAKTLAEYTMRCDMGFYLPRWTQRLILHRTVKGFYDGLRKNSCSPSPAGS